MLFGLIVTHSSGKTTPYTPFRDAGTSMATPLVAGMVADAEQGQPKDFGFLNPLLYSLAGSQAFHDILPVSPSDPQVDRAFYTPGLTDVNNKFNSTPGANGAEMIARWQTNRLIPSPSSARMSSRKRCGAWLPAGRGRGCSPVSCTGSTGRFID
jgi:hypothetical protein